MRFDLSGRLALVTGASRGIGAAVAEGLAEVGADIVAVGRSATRLEPTAQAIRALGRHVTLVEADISDEASIANLFETLQAQNLAPDILINNAGMEQVAPALDLSSALWDQILGTNLRGAFLVAQRWAQTREGRGGSLINMGSLTSAKGVATAAPYTASKSGLLGLTRALAAEWAPLGLRVNALGPGYFQTELTEVFYRDPAWREAMLAKIPLGRFGELDDLKGAAIFLASDASAYMTGQILYVDGGTLAQL